MKRKLTVVDEFFIRGNKDSMNIEALASSCEVKPLLVQQYIDSLPEPINSIPKRVKDKRGISVCTQADSERVDEYMKKTVKLPTDRIYRMTP